MPSRVIFEEEAMASDVFIHKKTHKKGNRSFFIRIFTKIVHSPYSARPAPGMSVPSPALLLVHRRNIHKITIKYAYEFSKSGRTVGQPRQNMKSYDAFQNKHKPWFYSPNGHLSGAAKRPSSVSFQNWTKLHERQRRFLAELAGLDDRRIGPKDEEVLQQALKKWPSGLYPVYMGGGVDSTTYTCNIFVGDSMFYAGKAIFGKYHSAREFWEGRVPDFALVDKKKGVKRGDVAAFGGHHLEIVTSVDTERDWGNDLCFCSRGAGRSSGDQGTEKCGMNWRTLGTRDNRYVDSDDIKFYRLVR